MITLHFLGLILASREGYLQQEYFEGWPYITIPVDEDMFMLCTMRMCDTRVQILKKVNKKFVTNALPFDNFKFLTESGPSQMRKAKWPHGYTHQ